MAIGRTPRNLGDSRLDVGNAEGTLRRGQESDDGSATDGTLPQDGAPADGSANDASSAGAGDAGYAAPPDAPVERVGMAEVPLPYAKGLETAAMPNEDRIVAAVLTTLGLRG